MAYFKKISSLKEKASYQVAINLCQDKSFKMLTMCLKKPAGDNQSCNNLCQSRYLRFDFISSVNLWDTAVVEQCERLSESLPSSLKQEKEIHVWINRIAFEYLSYSRRQELLFGVSRNFLMDFLTRSDWKEDARLNEMKVAKRLLKDERLTIMQRYRIACVYCLHINIPQLWSRLTQEEKQSISRDDDPYYQGNEYLVLLWSEYMKGYSKGKVKWQRKHLWSHAAWLSVRYGNQMALISCWKRLKQDKRRQLVVYMALQTLGKWKIAQNRGKWREKLVSNKYRSSRKRPERVKHFNLPSYYSELVLFFLSKMNQRQKLAFFKAAFEDRDDEFNYISVLQCFLDWPLQDYFLPTMNLLWGITPKNRYGQCLLTLACKDREEYEIYYDSVSLYKKEIHYYDYQSVLWNLWEETPEDYKQYVLCDKKHSNEDSRNTMIKTLFLDLLKKDPFQEKDVALFKRIWYDIPQLEKKAIMCCQIGEIICVQLFEKGKMSFVKWLFEESLPNVEIPKFKQKFMKSIFFKGKCLEKLEESCEGYVENLINWSLESDSDKTQFKYEIINHESYGLDSCSYHLRKGDFAKVERIIEFCLSSDEMKKQFKMDVVKNSCSAFLMDCSLEQIDKVLAWNFKTEEEITDFKNDVFYVNVIKSSCCALLKNCLLDQIDKILMWNFETEEEIKNFKKDLFNSDGFDTHYNLVFIQRQWKNVQCFYEWFCLSSEEITKMKKETVFSQNVMNDVYRDLYAGVKVIVASLRWCLTSKEMVISFREELEQHYFQKVKNNREKMAAKSRLGNLVRDLLHDITKGHEETTRENTFFKGKGEKRSLVIEDDESSSVPSYKHLKVKNL